MTATHGVEVLRGVSLEGLRGFDAAARLLNFTRAADELHLTQSAISREIRVLEDRLGARLFERAKNGLRLTRAGMALQKDVADALATLRRGLGTAAGNSGGRPLVILANRVILSEWLLGRVAQYTDRNREVEVRFAPATRPGTVADNRGLEDIDGTDIDISIRLLPRAMAEGRWERLLTEYVFPCCAPSLANLARRPLKTLDDLRRHTLIDLDDGFPPLDAHWSTWLKRAGIPGTRPAKWLLVPDWSLVFALAAEGRGVCMGRVPSLNDRFRRGVLVAPLPEVILSTRAYYLLQSTRSKTDPVATSFVEWLRQEARREETFIEAFVRKKRVISS
jgi:LysR family glycine cleavage system transcriptional activator